MAEDSEEDIDWIEEEPMTHPEFDRAFVGILSRTDRRRFWRAIREAGLVVFRA